jgi:hypothetical protein
MARSGLPLSTADRRAAKRDVATAALLATAGQAVAPSLQHVAATPVAACAGDATAIFSCLAANLATAKIYLAACDAIVGAAARAKAVAGHLTKILHGDTCHLVVGAAMNLEAISALLKPQLTTRQHKELATYLSICNRRAKLGTKLRDTSICRQGTLKQNSI